MQSIFNLFLIFIAFIHVNVVSTSGDALTPMAYLAASPRHTIITRFIRMTATEDRLDKMHLFAPEDSVFTNSTGFQGEFISKVLQVLDKFEFIQATKTNSSVASTGIDGNAVELELVDYLVIVLVKAGILYHLAPVIAFADKQAYASEFSPFLIETVKVGANAVDPGVDYADGVALRPGVAVASGTVIYSINAYPLPRTTNPSIIQPFYYFTKF